jgi:adenine phosphoribosyltransferase
MDPSQTSDHLEAPLKLQDYIAAVPDFPKPGILFRDITPLLAHPPALAQCIEQFASIAKTAQATHVIGIESRGFIFGAPLAQHLKLPLILARKPGKLPRTTHQITYDLEYGTDQLCIHRDDLPEGSRPLIIDDLLATGGTAEACIRLARAARADVVSVLFLIELEGLKGRERLKSILAPSTQVQALIHYP